MCSLIYQIFIYFKHVKCILKIALLKFCICKILFTKKLFKKKHLNKTKWHSLKILKYFNNTIDKQKYI